MSEFLLDILFFPSDFIIESPGSFFVDILLNVLSISGGFGVAWIFYKKEKKREKTKEAERLKEIEEYTNTKLAILSEGMKKQLQEILKLSNGLRKRRDFDVYFSLAPNFNSTALLLVSRIDLYKIFTSKSDENFGANMAKYNTFVGIIEAVSEYKGLLPSSFLRYIRKKEKHTEQWNDALTSLHRIFDTYTANLRIQGANPDEDAIISEFYRLKFNLAKKQRPKNDNNYKDLYITYDEFITPLFDFVQGHFEDPRSQIFMNYILDCKAAYNNIEYTRKFYRRNFIKDALRIRKLMRKLNDIRSECKPNFILDNLTIPKTNNMNPADIYKELCTSLRHYSSLMNQTRIAALTQGLIILFIPFASEYTSTQFFLINGFGLLMSSFMAWMNANYLRDFEIHLETLVELEYTNNIKTSWTIYAERHYKIKENKVLGTITRHGVFIFLALAFILTLFFHILK